MNYILTSEFAAKARAPESTVRYWRHIGVGPRGAKVGRRVLYNEQEVDDWLREPFHADDDQPDGREISPPAREPAPEPRKRAA